VVYYSVEAYNDLDCIFYGLVFWPKHPLEPKHAIQYMRDIEKICSTLDCKAFHEKSTYNLHRRFGNYLHRYKRNQNTCWYIIYDKDLFNNVFIERIMNNYITI
jgi:hypothetical protein